MAATALLIALSGCAGGALKAPSSPDQSALAPAEQALAKARAAQADTFAPRTVDASRRRIASARDILYGAAQTERPLTGNERARVDQLVAAAELDARAALVETQAKATRSQLQKLRADSGGGVSQANGSPRSTGAMDMSP